MRFIGALALCIAPLLAEPKITFVKSFPKSTPAYVSIEVQKNGSAVYKEAVNDEQPVDFKLSAEDTAAIFDLADKSDHFSKPLESGLKVAFMGDKTLRWEDGATKHESKFNYTLDENAKSLVDWFERLTETQLLLFDLERTARFDRLGVNKSILQIEALYDRKRIVGPERFLPLLDRVAKNESYLHMARERAASLAEAIRGAKTKAE